MAYTVKCLFSYEDTEQTRLYAFDCAESQLMGVKTKIKLLNQSLASGTAGGLESFFQSDDGHNFAAISDASIASVNEYPIDLNGGV